MPILIAAIAINIFFCAWWVINQNILFHTDIARDFLLMEDIWVNRNISLIGPRSGAIPGVFHGPLWLYLNLPSFIIGKGDPVFVGWFWVFLSIVTVIGTYYVGKKLFTKNQALIAAVLVSMSQAKDIKNLFNPYGALLVTPFFILTTSKYFKNNNIKYLAISLFLAGLMIQFQMAFGVPILILFLLLIFYSIIKNKKLKHFLVLPVIFIPLSSFIIFDLRHNFLQTNAVIKYVLGIESPGAVQSNFFTLLSIRFKEMTFDTFGMIASQNKLFTSMVLVVVLISLYKMYKNNKFTIANPNFLIIYLFLGFWVISLIFKGPMWSYYYWPFLPLLAILFASCLTYLNKLFYVIVLILLISLNTYNNFTEVKNYNPDYHRHGESSWLFNKKVAEKIFNSTNQDFGYFIFTPDLYGYYPRYAMIFVSKEFSNINAYPYEKRPTTFLLIAPPPSYGKSADSEWFKKNINQATWKSGDLNIQREPDEVETYQNGFVVEKYNFSDKEASIPTNPNLIKDLIFR